MDTRVGLLVPMLILALGSGVVAQSPSPPPWFGGRVEMPEHGFAVTLPDDWVGFDPAADALSQRDAASGFLDPAVWPEDDAAWIDGFADTVAAGHGLFFGQATSRSSCGLSAWISDMPTVEVADSDFQWYADDPDARDVEPPQLIDHPAGPAYLIRMARRNPPGWGEWRPTSHYVLVADGVILRAHCFTDGVRPEDDWLSIVETIEFLPAEEPSPPPWLGGRVEMPEHGFAVTLPDDWIGVDTAADAVSQAKVIRDVFDPAFYDIDAGEARWIDAIGNKGAKGVPLWTAHATSSSVCDLGPRPWDVSFFEAVDHLFEFYSNDPDFRDVKPRLISLPSGTAYHVRMTFRDQDEPDSDQWWPGSYYLLGADGVFVYADCWAYGARPDDDWLNIVEAIEFLPAEE
jgi:hypothetical protein